MAKNYVIECGEIVIKHTGNIIGARNKAMKIANENNCMVWIYVESNEYALPLAPVENVYPTATEEPAESKTETIVITDENKTNYDLDTMIDTINDIFINDVLPDGYKEFSIYSTTNKTKINIFVNNCLIGLELYDDLDLIDKLIYASNDYKKTLFHWLKYIE